MEVKDNAWLRKQYHLDTAAYEQVLVYGTASAIEADEIAVFKQSDQTKRKALLKLCQQRVDRQLKSFQGYAPRQSALLEKASVYEDGRYVVVLIHPQQSQMCIRDRSCLAPAAQAGVHNMEYSVRSGFETLALSPRNTEKLKLVVDERINASLLVT